MAADENVLTRFSISEFSTFPAPIDSEIEALAAAGAAGIGLVQSKLGEGRDDEVRTKLADAGMRAGICFPTILSIFPAGFVRDLDRLDDRLQAIEAGIARLARFNPVAIGIVAGDEPETGHEAGWDQLVKSLRRLSDLAQNCGARLIVEPVSPNGRGAMVNTLEQGERLLEDVGHSNLGLLADIWHLARTQDFIGQLERAGERVVAVQVADLRAQPYSRYDRLLPGDGVLHFEPVWSTLKRTNYQGWFDLETMSDDGRFGTRVPNSLWELPVEEFALRAVGSFRDSWSGQSAAEPPHRAAHRGRQ